MYEFSFNDAIPITGQDPAVVRSGFQQDLVYAFIIGPPTSQVTTPNGTQAFAGPRDPAQIAVANGLLAAIRWQPPSGQGQSGQGQSDQQRASEAAASARFAALPAATRHAWLAAHLTALRAGHVSLAQIP